MGFLGGIVLDLSPSSDAPFGQWALIFTVIGYLFAANRESVGDFTSQPFIFVLFVALSAGLSLGIYLIVGLILGENNGSFQRDLIIIAGNFLWTLLFAPIFLPAIGKVRRVSLSARERA